MADPTVPRVAYAGGWPRYSPARPGRRWYRVVRGRTYHLAGCVRSAAAGAEITVACAAGTGGFKTVADSLTEGDDGLIRRPQASTPELQCEPCLDRGRGDVAEVVAP